MKRIVFLLLVTYVAISCSKSEDKQENFDQYKLNVPEWLVGEWKYSDGIVTYDFEFSKDNYLLTKDGIFKSFKNKFVHEGEYSYFGRNVYYFIVYATATKKYLKYSFDMKKPSCYRCTEEEYKRKWGNKYYIRHTFEEVTEFGTTIEEISDNEFLYEKVR